jgi:hypothetical protein
LSEIDQAIQNAKVRPAQPQGKARAIQSSKANRSDIPVVPRKPPWPDFDFNTIEKAVRQRINLAEVSPINPSLVKTNEVVSQLFGLGWLCAGLQRDKPQIRMINEWLWSNSLSRMAYIVPSRMAKWRGLNKKGEPSVRCDDSIGAREYLIVECDIAKDKPAWKPHVEAWERDGITIGIACAGILRHLAQYAPLVLAVHSGGKSIHGWFACRGVQEEKLRRFMEYAVSLGADRSMWRISQWTRMPGGRRENGVRQAILYWDPATIEKWRTR